ncbi:hypothetical protein Pmani_012178 [Petrolisthes manimaculis]|uniref:Uncharacterized protein n=1 Tax=Petrolisthes manimaculis TaxID=1843537 RepID=A0AAE1UFC0_9EUCA|nr:hypothetical protein Pmani_012178 [Petrolisthes manimaculis]
MQQVGTEPPNGAYMFKSVAGGLKCQIRTGTDPNSAPQITLRSATSLATTPDPSGPSDQPSPYTPEGGEGRRGLLHGGEG